MGGEWRWRGKLERRRNMDGDVKRAGRALGLERMEGGEGGCSIQRKDAYGLYVE